MAQKSKDIIGPLGMKQVRALDHGIELAGAAWSPCGKYLVAAGCDGLVHRWTVDGWKKDELAGHGGWVQGIAFHPDGQRMFTADSWGQIAVWEFADQSPNLRWLTREAHTGWMKALAISPDGTTLATCAGDRQVRLWSSEDGKLVRDLRGHESPVFCLAFHPDGTALASGDLNGMIRHWDLASGRTKRTLDAGVMFRRVDEMNDVGGVRSLAFDAKGQTLAASGAEIVTSGFVQAKPLVLTFDWESGKQQRRVQTEKPANEDGFALDVTYQGDELLVACSGAPGRGALWACKAGEAKPYYVDATFAHSRSVRFDASGKRLALVQVGKGGGNGRQLNASGEYAGNSASIRIFEAMA
jgi:hypothetical protein